MWDSTAHVCTTVSIQYTSVLRVPALVCKLINFPDYLALH